MSGHEDQTLDLGGAVNEVDLLDRLRAGDDGAYEQLYASHLDSARRLATILAGPVGADDLVSEAFAKVLAAFRDGRGPVSNFRAYLHTTIRNLHTDGLRSSRERPSSDMPWVLDSEEPPAEDLVAGIDANGAVTALTSLPGTWQTVLWHLEVEGRRPAEVADLLTMTPAAVSSLAYRAREGLRQAYLAQNLRLAEAPVRCRWTRERLSPYVRADLSRRAARKVEEHLSGCVACSAVYAELDTLNKKLAANLFPVVLVGAMGALDATAAGASGGAVTAIPTGGFGKVKNGSVRHAALSGPVAATAAVVLVAAAVGAAWAIAGPDDHPRAGERPGTVSSDSGQPGTADPTADPVPTPVGPSTPEDLPNDSPTPLTPVEGGPQAAPPPAAPAGPRPLPLVRPVAPTATPVAGCDTYGALDLPTTPGVRYTLVQGDGRQGRWVVRASPTRGYALAPGAPARFSGDLGQYTPCSPPSIGSVSRVPTGDPATDPWTITVVPTVSDSAAHTLQVAYSFTSGVLITARSGDGWTCREPGGTEVGAGPEYHFPDPTTFTCTLDYTGAAPPPPVTLTLFATDPDLQAIQPEGTVSLLSDGTVTDSKPIS